MRRFILAAALLPFASAGAQATTSTDTTVRLAGASTRPATDSLFRRARRLVAEGNGVAGRALVDSLLRAADQTTPAYGDALYWHGALAPTAAEAERDYRRVIVEYPLAYYADDALLAIAELEQARGDRAGALMHLQRYVKELPGGAGRGIAALGAARLAFEQRDTKVGCSMIAAARSSAAATDVELRNQIEYYGRQCGAESAAANTPAPPPQPAPATIPVSAPPRVAATTSTTRAPVSTMPAPVTPKPRPPEPAAATRNTPPPPTRSTAATTPTRSTAPAPMGVASKAPAATPHAPASTGGTAGRMYTIQLAAYDTRPPAEALVTKLATRGVKARVSGTAKPFRVRLAFYKTRQEASAEVAALKARGIVGFVAEEVPPPGARSP